MGKLLYGQQVHQKVLLLGGKHEDAWISHEEWLLEIVEDRIKWTKVLLHRGGRLHDVDCCSNLWKRLACMSCMSSAVQC